MARARSIDDLRAMVAAARRLRRRDRAAAEQPEPRAGMSLYQAEALLDEALEQARRAPAAPVGGDGFEPPTRWV